MNAGRGCAMDRGHGSGTAESLGRRGIDQEHTG